MLINSNEIDQIEKILNLVDDPSRAFSIHGLQGLLHAVAITPDPIPPNQWLSVLFAGDGHFFDSTEYKIQSGPDCIF